MRTLEEILRELEVVVRGRHRQAGEGIAAPNQGLVAAQLLGCALGELEHTYKWFENGLPRTHLLNELSRRLEPGAGYELAGYDARGFESFYLRVPIRRTSIVVGPDRRRDVPVEFWATHREEGLVLRCFEDASDGEICLHAWSSRTGRAFRFLNEVDRSVDGCALVHGRVIRLAREGYTFLGLTGDERPTRHPSRVESAAEAIGSFLAAGAPGEHMGSLWHGPPGNGKTSLVRRLLRQAEGATRVWIDPAAMESNAVEETFSLLARVLRSLGEKDRALVVFEDIDTVASTRDNSEIRAWLSALDGVEQYRCRVAYLGLTNQEPRHFDPALVRPGRLGDVLVEFGPPDARLRRLILGDLLRDEPGDALDQLAEMTRGFSGAELELVSRKLRWRGRDRSAGTMRTLVTETKPAGVRRVGFVAPAR
jgi:hypothetical protein